MFSDKIAPIQPLSTDFFNGCRLAEEPDYALSTIHYLLTKPRFETRMPIYGTFKTTQWYFVRNVVDDLLKDENPNGPWFYYYDCPVSDTADADEFFSARGFEKMTLLEKFVSEKTGFQTLIYRNIERNMVFVLTKTLNMAVYHLIISFYSRLFPALFEDKPCTEEEYNLTKTLAYKNSTPFIDAVKKLLAPYEKDILRDSLAVCLNGFREAKLRNALDRVTSTRSQMNNLMSQYSQLATQLEQRTIEYEGLKYTTMTTEEETRDLIDYLASSENLMNINYQSGVLTFDAKTLLINVDADKFQNAVEYKQIYDSYTVPSDSVFSMKENRKLLLDALFGTSEPEMYVKIWGRISLGISGCTMTPAMFIDVSSDSILKDYLMNPHFAKYACPGRNRDQIVQCLSHYELVSAMECSVAATGSVNIEETDQTFRPFVQELLSSKNKVIHNRVENKDMTPEEALLWLMEKEKKNAPVEVE